MPVTVVSLAPALVTPAGVPGFLANAGRLAAAIRAQKLADPAVGIAVLPHGCLSAGDGVPQAWPADALLAPLADVAAELEVYVAGADRFAGESIAFVLAPDRSLAIVQPSITHGRGEARVAVADTPHGRIACLPDEDVLQAEYVRLAMFAGAELVLNPCIERSDSRSEGRSCSRGSRAWENVVALASASLGPVHGRDGLPSPACAARARGEIWNYSGDLVAAGDGQAVVGSIDPVGLRQRRTETWLNFPAQLRTGLYARIYADAARKPPVPEPRAGADAYEAYEVVMMQTHQVFIDGPQARDRIIADNLERAIKQARPFCHKPNVKLAVFPEFFMQGSDPAAMHHYWEQMCVRIPGPETDRLGEFARECGLYVCGGVFEYDPEWPGRFFNTSIILSPEGRIILRYRKIQCMELNGLLNVTTPGNVFSRYVEQYGLDALVPVVDTPIGRLGTMICYDALWPELWSSLALKGAEVICLPTSEIHAEHRTRWDRAKRAHAAENLMYLVSPNVGSEEFVPGGPITGMNRGNSVLLDYDGRVASQADATGSVPLLGRIELGTLRRLREQRRELGMRGLRPEAVAAAYARHPGFPLDCFLQQPMTLPAEGPVLVQQEIERLRRHGVYAAA